jgi:membrane protease YdiL (CAAX protease family)
VTAQRKKAASPTPRPLREDTMLTRVRSLLPDPPGDATPVDPRTTAVFVVTIILLVVFQYFGKPEAYRGAFAATLQPVYDVLSGSRPDMAPYAHWGVSSLVIRVLIPFAIILFAFREPVANYGWRWRGTLRHAPMYIGLYLLMIPLILWAASLSSFQQKYPFYKGAAAGGSTLGLYELFYGVQFLGVEFFFRGFLLFALFRRFGYNALLIMAIPYVMVHFNKPLPETLGALGAALILGALALRAGSCIPGVFLHWAVGITMDLLAISRQT